MGDCLYCGEPGADMSPALRDTYVKHAFKWSGPGAEIVRELAEEDLLCADCFWEELLDAVCECLDEVKGPERRGRKVEGGKKRGRPRKTAV